MSSPATHLRAPLLWILVPFIVGLIVAKSVPLPAFGVWPFLGIAIACCLASLYFARSSRRPKRLLWAITLCSSAAIAGFALLHLSYPHWHDVFERPPREVTVTVAILQMYPTSAQARSLNGLAKVIAASELEQELVGQRVYFSAIRRISVVPEKSGHYTLRGVLEPLKPVAGESSFTDYLLNQGARHTLTRAHVLAEIKPPGHLARFYAQAKTRLETILSRGLENHQKVRSLYLGMLLGSKAELSTDQQAAFMRSGTFHIFSVSGLHVGVISVALYGLMQALRVPRRAAVIANLALLWFYVQVTGGSTPAQRAFLMISFLLSSQVFRFPGNGLASLAAAALTTLIFDPLQLFSTGFQMSYSVVTALVLMAAPLSRKWQTAWQPFSFLPKINWRWYHHTVAWLGDKIVLAAGACWVAFLISTPSSIGYFEVFSPGSLLANLIVIPLSSLALISGFCALLVGLCGLSAWSVLFNSASAVILYFMDWLVQRGTALPGSFFTAGFRYPWVTPATIALLLAVMLAGSALDWKKRYGGFWPPVVVVALLLIFGVKFGGN